MAERPSTQSRREPTVFYGSCSRCGAGYWAEVQGGPHSPDTSNVMCGPSLYVVCQAHHPVSDVQLRNSNMMRADDRQAWAKWRRESGRA